MMFRTAPTARLLRLAAAGMMLASLPATAQTGTRLKAGLWEHGMQLTGQSPQLAAAQKEAQAAMAAMSPEQRKMMAQMMGQQGVGLDASGQKLRICLTPADVARDEPPPPDDGCTQTARRQGNTWTISFSCPGRDGEPPSSGRGTVTLHGPEAYSGQFTVTTRVEQQTEQLSMSSQGRWIAADCGSVRPVRR